MVRPISVVSASAIAIVLDLGSVQLAAAQSYGALAVVPGQGHQHHGYAAGQSAQEAQAAALLKCSRSNCEVVQVYRPGECAHIALGATQIWWNMERFTSAEGATVAQHCRTQDGPCRMLVSECHPRQGRPVS
jgi:hypothetical protein